MHIPFRKQKRRAIVFLPKEPEEDIYETYKKDVGMKTNKYNIIIQDKGLFDFFTIEKPFTEQNFKFKYKEEIYEVRNDSIFPIDKNIFTHLWRKITRSKLSYEYYVFFQKGNPKPMSEKPKERVTTSLLHTVMHSKTTEEMLKSLLKGEGFSIGGLNWRVIVMIIVTIGIGLFLANEMGFINIFPPITLEI